MIGDPLDAGHRSVRRGFRPLAAGLMLMSGLCYSVIPLLLVHFGGGDNPFLFNSVYRLGGVVGAALFLSLFHRNSLFDRRVISFVLHAFLGWRALWVVIPYFSFTAFAWSIRFVDVSLTTIIQEIWPVFFILLTARLLREEGRFDPPTAGQIVLALLGFAGFSFVVFSQAGVSFALDGRAVWGIALAVGAALMASATSYNYRWAHDLRDGLNTSGVPAAAGSAEDNRLLFFCLMVAFLVGSAASALVNFIPAAFVDGARLEDGAGWLAFLAGALFGGAFLDAAGTAFNRSANLSTSNLGVNALGYATPVFALLWLFLFSQVHVAQVDYLVIGATAIITANLLISSEAEIRRGFGSLLLARARLGTVVRRRDH